MSRLPSCGASARRTALAALLLLATACTSSLHTGQTISARDAPADVPGVTDGATGASTEVSEPSAPAVASGSAQPGGSPAGRPGGSPARPGTAAGPAAGSPQPGATRPGTTPAKPIEFSQGVTPTTIKIGVFLASYAGLEAEGLNMGDPVVQSQAVADYLNARGGIAGRKIVLSYAKLEASSTNWESDEQQICTTFTEDHKVWGVIYSLISQGNTLLPCLAQHNTPLLSGAGGVADRKGMQDFADFYYYTGGPDLTRMAAMYADGLHAQGYFSGAGGIGVVRLDSAPFDRAYTEALVPALARHGLKVTEVAEVDGQTSLSKTASQMPNIVLRFQQRGVDKVLFLDNATLGSLFAIQASSQSYYPAYGLTSLSAPAGLMQPNVPPEALDGARGVGWVPALDVDQVRDKDNPNPATRLCRDIMVKAGEGGVGSAGVMQQRMFCDELFLLKRTLDKATALTPKGLRAQVEALGTSYNSVLTFGTKFGPGRHDGAAAYRPFAYQMDCKCFVYSGPVHSAG